MGGAIGMPSPPAGGVAAGGRELCQVDGPLSIPPSVPLSPDRQFWPEDGSSLNRTLLRLGSSTKKRTSVTFATPAAVSARQAPRATIDR